MDYQKNENYPIDFVITWVDGNDPDWQKERDKYVSASERKIASNAGDERYIDDGLLVYIFRGIEKFAPWVNKIHFVTCGHLPKWLNTNHPKLNIVNHKDFVPEEFLPTFNDRPFSLRFHKIPGIADRFVYICDDMYFIAPVKRKLFFKKGLPRDMAIEEITDFWEYNDSYYYYSINNITLLNHIISKKDSRKAHFFKWYNPRYGIKYLLKNALLSHFKLFSGLYEPHTHTPYLKSSYERCWSKFEKEFNKTSANKNRTPYDCGEDIFRYYHLATGNFIPINRDKFGALFHMKQSNLPNFIKRQKKPLLCINKSDTNGVIEVRKAFDSILGEKCSFEK